jgi:large subunit ribosomal protein L17
MRKHVFGKQLSRDANERKALFKTLASSLVMAERVETTEAKAKALRPYVEKLVTKAKKRGLTSRQFIEPYLSQVATEKVLSDLSVRFAKRDGGYTRILRVGNRFFDNAPVVVMEWVERSSNITPVKAQAKKKKVTSKGKTESVTSEVSKLKATKDTTKQSGLRIPGFKTPLSRLARPASEKKG